LCVTILGYFRVHGMGVVMIIIFRHNSFIIRNDFGLQLDLSTSIRVNSNYIYYMLFICFWLASQRAFRLASPVTARYSTEHSATAVLHFTAKTEASKKTFNRGMTQ